MRRESLVDQFFGKRPAISDEALDAISHPEQIEGDRPFPVRVLPYLDETTNTMKNQLDSRGIRFDSGLSEQPGIHRISVNSFRKLSRGTPAELSIERDPQAAMCVEVVAHTLPASRAVMRVSLLPNEHGIKGSGSRHYLVEEVDLQPVYRESHPRVKKVAGVNFGMLIMHAVVDLINE